MSQVETVTVACPKCNAQDSFQLNRSFNAKMDPETAQKALTGDAFAFTCPKCGAVTYVNHGFLYSDPSLGLMVQYVACEDEIEPAVKMFERLHGASADDENPAQRLLSNMMTQINTRIVTDHDEVTEKVDVAQGGYDDRIMELTKLILGSKIAVEEKFDFDAVLYKPAHEKEQERIDFNDSKTNRVLSVPFENVRELYRSLSAQFNERIQNEYQADVVINAAWALEFLKKENQLG